MGNTRHRKRGRNKGSRSHPQHSQHHANGDDTTSSDNDTSTSTIEASNHAFRCPSPAFTAVCVAVFSAAVLVHVHIVDHAHDWVYDDGSVIEDNPMLKGDATNGPEQPLSQLLYTDYWGTPMSEDRLSHLSFRPFTSVTFRLQVGCCFQRCATTHVIWMFAAKLC